MVVEIDARRFTSSAIPLEDEPPLFVDADRVETVEIAVQLFKVVAGWHAQILIGCGVIDHLEFAE